ncbi:MAG TPA: DNA topoisomerase (ATP-hydrolyzing) [Anaerolineales bacterium]|nr:DNA topoisomerase (ATP-hydrolyzing) [Anaerolineales bacterium]
MDVGTVRRIDIDHEMQQSYLDYAMSVIVARALPDARDGLKPVHRRILHAMHQMGIRPEGEHKKSARIVGEVLGKFHPHGDMAVYEAMARMAQDFSMRYPLIDGQGNFGSVDGDSPAAMRYTEARLAPLAMEALADIDMDTVDFVPNFDGTLPEPVVLPSGFPNLLVNGATGIAVGMATSIPPHNMGEVCDACVFLLENWSRLDKVALDDLMSFVKGPDFPTGGILLRDPDDQEGLAAAYGHGKGRVTIQARAHIEDMGRGRSRIIVTELPYQTNKAALIERIAELARGGQMDGLADLRDESDRQGMRIVIEIAKTADAERVLAALYQRTPMQSVFGINLLALVDDEPRLLNLKQALRVYLEHRLTVTRRRSEYELARAGEKAHILAGLRTALQHLDEVIQLIRAASDPEQARLRLMKRFKLGDVQARAILDMPLRRLSTLERKKIDQDYKETQARIRALEELLASDKKMRAHVAEELRRIKSTYGDRRRTQIAETRKGKRSRELLTTRDLLEDKDTWVVVAGGRISRTPTARLPRLGGRDAPRIILGARTRDRLYLFASDGSGAATAVHTLSETEDPAEGNPVAGATALPPGSEPVAGLVLPAGQAGGYVVFATLQGMVKRTEASSLPGPSGRTFQAIKLNEGDRLGWVRWSPGKDNLVLVSSGGLAIRFSEEEVRPVGLQAAGVLGMRLESKERLVGADLEKQGGEVLLVAANGLAKRTPVKEFPVQGRHGRGVRAWKSGVALGAAALGEPEDHGAILFSKAAGKSAKWEDVPRRARAGGGAKFAEVRANDRVTALALAARRPALELPEPEKKPARKPKRAAKPAPKAGRSRKPTKSKGPAVRAAKRPPSKKPAKKAR